MNKIIRPLWTRSKQKSNAKYPKKVSKAHKIFLNNTEWKKLNIPADYK